MVSLRWGEERIKLRSKDICLLTYISCLCTSHELNNKAFYLHQFWYLTSVLRYLHYLLEEEESGSFWWSESRTALEMCGSTQTLRRWGGGSLSCDWINNWSSNLPLQCDPIYLSSCMSAWWSEWPPLPLELGLCHVTNFGQWHMNGWGSLKQDESGGHLQATDDLLQNHHPGGENLSVSYREHPTCSKENGGLKEEIPTQDPAYSSPVVTATHNIEHEIQLLLFKIIKFWGDISLQ